MSIVNRSRNIFIDSEQYHSNGDLVKLYLPNEAFSTFKDESMRIVLSSFEMKKNFYNINKYNNTFYAYNIIGGDVSYTPITIEEGDYHIFGENKDVSNSLCKAISDALTTSSILHTNVTYNHVTRKLTLHVTHTDTSGFATFQIPENRQPNMGNKDITSLGMFQDSYEILGAKPTKYLDNSNTEPVKAFDTSVTNEFTSFYPASLYTIDSVHLVTSIQNNNYQTPTLDANSSQSRLIPTQVFARIPLDMFAMASSAYFEQQTISDKIKFEDTGSELFSINLQQKQIDNINFSICDPKGRKIEEIGDNQYDNGALSYKMVLKWEAIHNPEIGQPSGYLSNSRQFHPYQETKFIKEAFK